MNSSSEREHTLTMPRSSRALPTVFVIDDDISVRESLALLITRAGWESQVFATAEAFLTRPARLVPSCLVLDVTLPGISGLDLQQRIADRTCLPVIFITGQEDVATSVRAMKAGAVEFLMKPIGDEVLLFAIEGALDRSNTKLRQEAEIRGLSERYRSLTPRERQVMGLVVRGRLNKQVGGELGIAEITTKVHRSNVMRKMKAGSLADLVNMAGRLQVGAAQQFCTSTLSAGRS